MSEIIYNKFFDKEIYIKVNEDNKYLLEDFLLELKQNKKSRYFWCGIRWAMSFYQDGWKRWIKMGGLDGQKNL